MKKIKILTPVIGLATIAGAIAPLASCSCKSKDDPEEPVVAEDIDYSEAKLTTYTPVGEIDQFEASCTFTGFKLIGNYDINGLIATPTNISAFVGDVTLSIVANNDTTFSIVASFSSYFPLSFQFPRFDIEIKDTNHPDWAGKKIEGCKAYFSAYSLIILDDLDQGETVEIATDKSQVSAFLGAISTPYYLTGDKVFEIDNFDIVATIDPEYETQLQVKPSIYKIGDSGRFSVKLDISNITKDETVPIIFSYTNKLIPNWSFTFERTLKVYKTTEEDKEKLFECEDIDGTNCKITKIRSCDETVELPTKWTIGGIEYNVTQLNVSYNTPSLNFVTKHLIIPETITTIDHPEYLSRDWNLEDIKVADSNSVFTSKIGDDETNCLIKTSTKEIITGTKNAKLLEGIEKIGDNAFDNSTLLTSIETPASLTYIDKEAFENCASLKTVDLSKSVNLTTLRYGTFTNACNLSSVKLPNTLETIMQRAFRGCEKLEQIDLPESLITLESNVFRNSGLKSLYIPKNVNSIHFQLCPECFDLETIIVDDNNQTYKSTASDGKTQLNCIMDKERTKLYEISNNFDINKLPSTIDTLSDGVFSEREIETITIPNTIKTIGNDAFSGCVYLQNITIPDSVETIGRDAFSGCLSLESATLPSKINKLSTGLFSSCLSLESVTIPETVKDIGDYVFSACISIENIKLPSNLETIGYDAFERCYYLESIDLPDTITSIGERAFEACTSLTSVKLPQNLTEIKKGLFQTCWYLESVIIPEGVKTIDNHAFATCLSLKTITLPSSLELMGNGAFNGCKNLEQINIPANVKEIAAFAFDGCASLTSATFADPTGWSSSGVTIPEETLKDPAKAAELLKTNVDLVKS